MSTARSWFKRLWEGPITVRLPIQWVGDGGEIPRFYGIVRRDLYHGRALTALIPLNLIMRAVNRFWSWARVGRAITEAEILQLVEDVKNRPSEHDSYRTGFEAGWKAHERFIRVRCLR